MEFQPKKGVKNSSASSNPALSAKISQNPSMLIEGFYFLHQIAKLA